jgi:hypothetical protein
MKKALITSVAFCSMIFAQRAVAQGGNQTLQQKLAAVKESIARNQASLRQYTWTEQTQISLKGEVKKTTQAMCRYGPDGQVQKTPLGAPPPQQEKRGLRGKVVEKKTDELKDYMEQAGALIKEYVPPSPEKMQQAFQQGNFSLGEGGAGTPQLQFKNYVKPGDSMVFSFNSATKSIQKINVNTYMNEPKDAVTLEADFQKLPDGTNYVATSILNATAKQIQVVKQNMNYQKVGQ